MNFAQSEQKCTPRPWNQNQRLPEACVTDTDLEHKEKGITVDYSFNETKIISVPYACFNQIPIHCRTYGIIHVLKTLVGNYEGNSSYLRHRFCKQWHPSTLFYYPFLVLCVLQEEHATLE